MLRKLTQQTAIDFSVIIIVIVLISCVPLLFQTGSFLRFFESVVNSFYYFIHPNEISVMMSAGREQALFEVLFPKYLNSMLILFSAFLVAVAGSVLSGTMYLRMSRRVKKVADVWIHFLESMPDVLILILAQIGFVWVFQQTGILVDVYMIGDSREDFLIPILCLSLVPLLHLFRFFVLTINEEKAKEYHDYARSKGLSEWGGLFRHLFRNVAYQFISHAKTILLFMLSNLLILEIIFEINGMMEFIKNFGIGDYRILFWCLLFLYIPCILFLRMNEWWIRKVTGQWE